MHSLKGFTLIELLMVTAIIGVLLSVAAPMYQNYVTRAQLVETALMLGQWGREFSRWNGENGRYPNDSHIILPPEALGELIIDNSLWLASTALGGNWNWEGPDGYPYAAISIYQATAPVEDIAQLDFILDDGDLSNGIFRQTPNGRYSYILDE
ncbi:MAG: hypothetical protein CMQ17_06085 [Gammaproteobacteria bacterium]|jgi:type IV pilus assembly protein PilA|nr:hypothetical protein [Gammaproteobacteria bacterium]|tara:strand:- start:13077 stop:13535 length:459 start_codon:yes stop_codon:yes gene_type:complete